MNLDLHAQGQGDHIKELRKEEKKGIREIQKMEIPKNHKRSLIIKLKDRFLKHILETDDSVYVRNGK